MRWTIGEIATVTEGRAEGDPAGPVDGASIDTRTLEPGQLFVAVQGARDGHDFATAAVEAGAGGLLVERSVGAPGLEIVVGDAAGALLRLGHAARRRLDGPVIGITGSVGKTSTKDMAADVLSAGRRTVASPRSFNNELGLPLTLLNAPGDTEVVVLEMGARGPGHVALLCQVAEPTIGVVTAVAAAHTEMFGDLEGVARAKSELVQALPVSGFAVLNGDDHRTRAMQSVTPASVLLYSASGHAEADVVATNVELDDQLRPSFHLRSPWGSARVRMEARGAHQVGNALAAIAVGALAGVDVEAGVGALEGASLSPFRMEVRRTAGGATVINDAYNANPASMAAALRALAALGAASRRVAVLGPMAELGPTADAEHLAIAALAEELGIEVIAFGTSQYGGSDRVDDVGEVVARLAGIGPDTAVLVKASRVAELERVASALLSA
jgi:UDP-N-acetylmuramoyl-tripeptide--D-alanyl-D-alanine ligase